MSHLNKKEIKKKLPNIYKKLKEKGYDLTKDNVPITPAAHYQCGGITTDLNGKTSVKNLFAVGEVARTGVHGANRLASNSLLEAVVWGKRAGMFIVSSPPPFGDRLRRGTSASGLIQGGDFSLNSLLRENDKQILNKIKNDIQKTMWEKVGIVRRKNELLEALKQFRSFKNKIEKIRIERGISHKLLEVINLLDVAILITKAALNRSKSLGAHYLT